MKKSYLYFYQKFVSCELKTGFFLYGTVDDINEHGIFLTTNQKSSWIAWDEILTLLLTTEKVN